MVYYFSIRRNYPQPESLTQAEFSAIEQIAAKKGIRVKVEIIDNGTIIYLDDTFPKENFLRLKEIFIQNAKLLNPDNLPEKYGTWYDSVTDQTLYFAASGEEYIRFSLSSIAQFISGDGSKLISDIYKRLAQSNSPQKDSGENKKAPKKIGKKAAR